MLKKHYPQLILCICLFLLPASIFAADNNANRLTAAINRAHYAGVYFRPVTLFSTVNGAKHQVLREEVSLTPNINSIKALHETRPEGVAMSFTDATGKVHTLELLRNIPTAFMPNFGFIRDGKRVQSYEADAIHYQGALKGEEQSFATMSIFGDGTVMILFANGDGNFVLGQLEDGSGNYVLYNDKDMVNRPDMPCGVSEKDYPDKNRALGKGAQKTTNVNMCRKVSLYWESDYQFFVAKGGTVTAAQNYLSALFNQVQAMYKNENISVELKSVYVWVTDDAYPNGTSTDGLYTFRAYWNGLNNSYDGDLAHLITMDNSSNGGVAYVGVLDASARDFSYAYSEISGSYANIPTFSWDVEVVTHEMGHNLGSRHTQWCGWATGPSGSCGSIDNCVTQEVTNTCNPCTYKQYDNALSPTSWKGTVMSYCHLVSRGINLANGFGPLPGDLIRTNVSVTPNLKSVLDVTLTPTTICAGSSGAITLTFKTDTVGSRHFGVAPYTYTWSNGGNTQSIGALSVPGSYNVTVTDSNGCAETFFTKLAKYPTPGQGQDILHSMPICCNDPVTMNISASMPAELSSCQTVAWVRTSTAVTTYNDAKTAIVAANPVDIMYSTNSSSINNTTPATLTISSPVPCSGLQTIYYTPFVSRKTRTSNTVTTTATASGSTNMVSFNGTEQVGNYVELNDQLSSIVACDTVDTAVTQNIVVTISSYTGRSGQLTLIVQNFDGTVLYRASGLAGSGTYNIPIKGYTPLQFLRVSAFDYNCQGTDMSTNCTTSDLSISATRTVTYGAIAAPMLEPACAVGKSVMISFAPNNCTPLSVGQSALPISELDIYPNPATQSATLAFYAQNSGKAVLKMTDVTGKVINNRSIEYASGRNAISVDLQDVAKGVYFVMLDAEGENSKATKLIVQ